MVGIEVKLAMNATQQGLMLRFRMALVECLLEYNSVKWFPKVSFTHQVSKNHPYLFNSGRTIAEKKNIVPKKLLGF